MFGNRRFAGNQHGNHSGGNLTLWLPEVVTGAGYPLQVSVTPAVLVDTSVDTPRLDTKPDLYTTSKKIADYPAYGEPSGRNSNAKV